MGKLLNERWQKSSFSAGNGGDCVEAMFDGETVFVRDSKRPTGPMLAFTASEWVAFWEGVQAGEFRLV